MIALLATNRHGLFQTTNTAAQFAGEGGVPDREGAFVNRCITGELGIAKMMNRDMDLLELDKTAIYWFRGCGGLSALGT